MTCKAASYPSPLKKGATIGVISPASGIKNPQSLDKGQRLLEELGFKVVLHPQNNLSWGQLAGGDEARAQAIMDMFSDGSIDAILCARGGNGSIRLLELLDYDLISRNPKPFIGFSDVTALLNAFHTRCGMITYHGPMLSSSFGNEYAPDTLKDFLHVLANAGSETVLKFTDVEVLTPGMAEGTLIGGNLMMLQSIAGTPYGWSGDKAILFIEDVDEMLYRLDRTLRHLHLSGILTGVAAVLVGKMNNIPDTETSFMRPDERPYGPNFRQIMKDIFPNVPLALDIPCGHNPYITTFPVGAPARILLSDNTATMTLLSKYQNSFDQ